MAQLVQYPAAATRLLGERLKPATAPNHEQMAALIQELSSPRFVTRHRASDALVQMGEDVLPTITKAMAAHPDLETRRRLQQIFSRATNVGYRTIRAVAVLEEIADDDAVRVLKTLGKGLPESRQTAEAQIALRRLRR